MSRRASIFAAVAVATAICRTGIAEPSAVVVLVPSVDVLSDGGSFTSAVSAALADVQVRIVFESAAPGEEANPAVSAARQRAMTTFWLRAEEGDLFLYGYERANRRAQRRRLSATREQAAIEEMSVIVREAVLAQIEGAHMHLGEEAPAPAPPPPAPPPAPAPPPTPPRPPSEGAAIDLAYFGSLLGPRLVAHGVAFAVHVPRNAGYDVAFRVAGFGPVPWHVADATLLIQRATAQGEIALRVRFGSSALRLGAGAFVDSLSRTVEIQSDATTPSSSDGRVTFGPLVSAEYGFGIAGRIHGFVGGVLEMPLRVWKYRVTDTADGAVALSWLRPGVQGGLRLDL